VSVREADVALFVAARCPDLARIAWLVTGDQRRAERTAAVWPSSDSVLRAWDADGAQAGAAASS